MKIVSENLVTWLSTESKPTTGIAAGTIGIEVTDNSLVYNTANTARMYFFNGSTWVELVRVADTVPLGSAADYVQFDSTGKSLIATVTQLSATPTTGLRVIYGKNTTFSTHTTGTLVGVRGEANIPNGGVISGGYLYGAQGKLVCGTGTTINGGSGHFCGVLGQADLSGVTSTSGHIAPVISSIQDTSSTARPAVNGFYAELPTYGSGAKMNSVLQGNGGCTYMLDMLGVNADFLVGVPASGLTPYSAGTVTATGKLALKVGGNTYYINVGAS